ncbi:hypothetical protein [Thermomonospora cellulosilytica]|uniref:Uncharacterized protein n=1 Tax=Thermomonospora cellulosilytica TaxID=1411118 RepID=A0A7W3N001_9ACTN|nr:hypothetical protein [Thermomonospora cellulosilytica]MBA9004999.1 hypothetical protein [Thermomonospora cellulosilytica]
MAMVTGKVDCLSVQQGAGFTRIAIAPGRSETLFLWFGDPEISSLEWVMHSMWLAMLREAINGDLNVRITFPDEGGAATSVQIDKP